MKIIKDLYNHEISFVDNDNIRLKLYSVPSYFVFDFSYNVNEKNPIVVSEENDYYLYNNLIWLMNQNYYFSHNYSLKNDNRIMWLSEHCFNLEDEFELDNTPRLIIEKKDNCFIIYCKRPFFENNNINRGSCVSFAPAGNGFYSKNLDSSLSFQDDIINVFYKSLNDKLINTNEINNCLKKYKSDV